VVEVRGEIDILTASPLSARLDALTAGPCPDLVLALRPVTFLRPNRLADVFEIHPDPPTVVIGVHDENKKNDEHDENYVSAAAG
jgi:hypothetical protein